MLIRIGDGRDWLFANGDWIDGPDGSLDVPEQRVRQDGTGIQGHHYAFLRGPAYGSLRARFRFKLNSHSDIGLILGACDPAHFSVLHFPDCGQASRAQHFWTALSRSEGDGWIRIGRMDLVRRVASTSRDWHSADVRVAGGRVTAEIDGLGRFEASDPSLAAGRIGVYRFGGAAIADLEIDGDPVDAPWSDGGEVRPPWFHPCPDREYGRWQRPGHLVRLGDDGDLLLSYSVQERPYSGKVTPLLARSADRGRTWSRPEPIGGLEVGDWEGMGIPHRFPDGALRMLAPKGGGYVIVRSDDAGRTWVDPMPSDVPPAPAGMPRIHVGPLVNLADGAVLLVGYGGHESTVPGAHIAAWGSHHCRAYACRSEDAGRTWSPWVNIDGTDDGAGNLVGGNLDLTEVCAAPTGDGRIVALIRPIYSPWMWETWSTDGGRSWTPCMRGSFPGYATSNLLRTASGTLLVAHRLPGLTIHASYDDDRTWDAGTMIDSAIWAMGGMVEVAPDIVLYVYWDSFESLMRAQYIRVGRDRLDPVRGEDLP